MNKKLWRNPPMIGQVFGLAAYIATSRPGKMGWLRRFKRWLNKV